MRFGGRTTARAAEPAGGALAAGSTMLATRCEGAMHERASRPRHRRWTVRRTTTTTTTTKMAPMVPMDRRRRRSTARECAPDGDASPARLDVDDILDSLTSSQVRSRLLAAALEYSVEATMNDFPGANIDARGPPVAAAYLRGFLRNNLGANLHIEPPHEPPSPTHALLASLPPERPGGGTWTDDDVRLVAVKVRALMLARLDLRIRALDLHGTRVLLRGRDTNLVTSAAASWSHSGARRRRADAGAPPPPAVELREALAAGDEAFAARVAEAHGAWHAAAARVGGGGGGAGAAREGKEGEPPVLTADDVLRTLRNLANPNPNPPDTTPSASPCTYDRGFMDSRFADDALP